MRKSVIFFAFMLPVLARSAQAGGETCTKGWQTGTAAIVTSSAGSTYLTVIAPFHGTDPAECAPGPDIPCKTFLCSPIVGMAGPDCSTAIGSCVDLLLTNCDDGSTVVKIVVLPATSCGPV